MDRKNSELIDNTGKFTRSITYSEFKNSLDEGRKRILAEYESSIIDLFSVLEKNNFLRKEFTAEEIERVQKLQYTSLHVHSIIHNSYTIAGKFRDISFMNHFQTVARNEGFDVHNIAEQVIVQICMSYVYSIEYLKRDILLLVDFEKMGLKNPGKRTFGVLIDHLKKHNELSKNSFVNFLSARKRNALAHFSFYYENSKLWLCVNGHFDPNPEPMELWELMKESLTLNALALAFYLIYVREFRN